MASGFPGSIDNFTDPLSNSSLSSPSHAGQHADLNDAVEKIETYMGLVKVIPTGVSSAGGTAATLASNGTVTIGTSNTSITLNGVFSSLYRNYRVVWSVAGQSATSNLQFSMNASGSTVYYTSGIYMAPSSATVNGYQTNTTSNIVVGVWQSGLSNATGCFDVQSPNLAARTFVQSQSGAPGYFWWGGGQVADSVQNTDFTFSFSSGNVTGGSIVVYGYRN
jgi:hypothetical protein